MTTTPEIAAEFTASFPRGTAVICDTPKGKRSGTIDSRAQRQGESVYVWVKVEPEYFYVRTSDVKRA